MHARRQAEQRAAMAHAGEAEAAIAIAIDRRLVRVEPLPRLSHRPRLDGRAVGALRSLPWRPVAGASLRDLSPK